MHDDIPPSRFHGTAWGPENAEAHRRVMEFFRTATEAELAQTLIDAGIVDAQGNVLPPYCDEPTPGLGPRPR